MVEIKCIVSQIEDDKIVEDTPPESPHDDQQSPKSLPPSGINHPPQFQPPPPLNPPPRTPSPPHNTPPISPHANDAKKGELNQDMAITIVSQPKSEPELEKADNQYETYEDYKGFIDMDFMTQTFVPLNVIYLQTSF